VVVALEAGGLKGGVADAKGLARLDGVLVCVYRWVGGWVVVYSIECCREVERGDKLHHRRKSLRAPALPAPSS